MSPIDPPQPDPNTWQRDLALSCEVVTALFPFYLLIENSEQQKVLSMGASLVDVFKRLGIVVQSAEQIKLIRPVAQRLSSEHIISHAQAPFSFRVSDTNSDSNIVLRGQFMLTQGNNFLFLGSPQVRGPESLDEYGLGLKHFAPFDLTPDVVIAHRFREIQARDQRLRADQLRAAEKARDASDHFANSDALTGIPNRRGFWRDGKKMLRNRRADCELLILLFDLERFKFINDKYGHKDGDSVLLAVAERLCIYTRDHGIAARLGGDEFVALVSLSRETSAQRWVEDLAQAIRCPVESVIQGQPIDCSIGVAIVEPDQSLDDALQHADLAMYEGREQGANSTYWDSLELQARNKQRNELLQDLKQAIDDKAILPVFQPIVDLKDNSLMGFETLARWQHPEWGMIMPFVFIELAEHAGLLPALDRLMLEHALDCLMRWKAQGKSYTMHINVSAPSLQPELFTTIEEALRARGLDSSALVLELTETSFLEHSSDTEDLLQAITAAGVRLQLDDFGTGYSSLTHLHSFPVSGIKIDRSFVKEAHTCPRAQALLKSVIGIADNLGLETVGEGIENLAQLELLRGLGCQHGQGYLFGKPEVEEICEQLNNISDDKAA